MYLKIKFIFYLTSGAAIEEEIYYKKRNKENSDEEFQNEVAKFEYDFRKELSEAMRYPSNRLLNFGNTVLIDKSLLAFKTFLEEVSDFYEEDVDKPEENFSIGEVQPFDIKISGEGVIDEK